MKMKNEYGFTLIELLAVIVVLAIVLLMGATAVIPRMNAARKQVFAMEANQVIESATLYLQNNVITGGTTFPVGDNESKCVTVSELIESGTFSADKDKYEGKVMITKKAGSDLYLYQVYLSNGTLMVNGSGLSEDKLFNKDIESEDVIDFNSTEWDKVKSCESK